MNFSLFAVGRVMLGLFFVASGVLKLIGVTDAGGLAPLTGYIAARGLPLPQVLAALVIVFEIAAGLAIVFDRWLVPVGVVLTAFCLATAVLFHNFWTYPLDQVTGQLYNFMKNIGLAGAFLLLADSGRQRA